MTAIPERLRVLDDAGCIVTIAARGGQQEIAQTIRAEKADAVRRVKPTRASSTRTFRTGSPLLTTCSSRR